MRRFLSGFFLRQITRERQAALVAQLLCFSSALASKEEAVPPPQSVPPIISPNIVLAAFGGGVGMEDSGAAAVEVPEPNEIYANGGIILDPAQEAAVADVIHKGRNVFITGGAGTGKSVIVRELAKRLPKHSTFLTGTTGVAAMNVGGTTLHSFAGIGMGDDTAPELARRVFCDLRASKRWQQCEALVIDEISMLQPEL